ncbi:hypothetical protein [Pelagibacterium xiamenense]|uniref:hypothetical protein n=1 Tax=Pelagibacterium xiamenense TaxID=2901140 RepID=UPI001E3EE9E5|nr:hypothetical protein [Pelagibacterium xiamenense]MCD7060069.1 hypothetical protein [Pelagibacterium xiamenense]
MEILANILLFLHLFALVLGMGAGIALSMQGRLMASAGPELRTGLLRFGEMLRVNSYAGIALLWITGPLIVWLRYGGAGGLGAWFWVKMAFVVALTISIAVGAASYPKAKTGDADAMKRVKLAGMGSGIFGLLAIFSAVFAFN